MIRIVLLCCFIYFISCSSNNLGALDNDSKNASYLYGIGYGKDANSAKENAIKDLATSLQVSIQVQAQNTTVHNDYSLKTSGIQHASLESGFTDLSGIELDKVSKAGDLVVVRVRATKAILRSQILQRMKAKQDFLKASIEKCGYPSLKSYEMFKIYLKELQNDINVISALGGSMTSYQLEVKDYGAIAARKLSYDLNVEQSIYVPDVLPILLAELSKFMIISKESTRTINAKITSDKYIGLELVFLDCNGDVEDSININSYIDRHKLNSNNNKTRLGAFIYKTLYSFMSDSM